MQAIAGYLRIKFKKISLSPKIIVNFLLNNESKFVLNSELCNECDKNNAIMKLTIN